MNKLCKVMLPMSVVLAVCSCKSSDQSLAKGGLHDRQMPAEEYLALLDGIDSAICVSLDYNKHWYAEHPMTYAEASAYASRMADEARREMGTYKSVSVGGYSVLVRSSDEYDLESMKDARKKDAARRWDSFGGGKDKAYMDSRGTSFVIGWRWGCALNDKSERDRLNSVAERGTAAWTWSKGGGADLDALGSGKIVVDTAYVVRGSKAWPVGLKDCRFKVQSNPPARYELSGTFVYKGHDYTFKMCENQRHNTCDKIEK